MANNSEPLKFIDEQGGKTLVARIKELIRSYPQKNEVTISDTQPTDGSELWIDTSSSSDPDHAELVIKIELNGEEILPDPTGTAVLNINEIKYRELPLNEYKALKTAGQLDRFTIYNTGDSDDGSWLGGLTGGGNISGGIDPADPTQVVTGQDVTDLFNNPNI